jgi:Chaperone of endosialidase
MKMEILRGLAIAALCSLTAHAQQASTNQESQPNVPPPATVTGSGTANYIPMWTGTSTLGNSKMFQTGGKIGVGTTTPAVALDVNGRVNASKDFSLGGSRVLAAQSDAENLAVGLLALQNFGTSEFNTAVGGYALQINTGSENTATGASALFNNTTGQGNSAFGSLVMLQNTQGSDNTAVGISALGSNTTGSDNIAIGFYPMSNNLTGSSNIAIGTFADAIPSSGNNNIQIGNEGTISDNGTIRIGTAGTQTSFFAAGVRGATTGLNDAVSVVIDSNGQLGTVNSSRRFKEDIADMGKASEGLLRLRPVTFRYQKPFADGSKPLQYGLIAEEVAEVYPDLVARSADGQIETVKYQVLDSMLLNELQQQQAEIQGLRELLTKVEAELAIVKAEKPR